MRYGKIWGTTRPVLQKPHIEVHELRIKAGHFCSEHVHRSKFNMFYVIEGELVIKTWKNDYDLIDETILLAGQSTIQRPGEKHQFLAVTNVHCLEIYWAELDPHDIVRSNVGGAA
jgi:quercetin dioxygenase-like cupin family protein